MENISRSVRKCLNMKKKKVEKFLIGAILFLIVFLNPITCRAAGALEDLGEDLASYGTIQGKSVDFNSKVSAFLGVFQVIGSVLAIICLIVLGIKYMMGSVEEKAQYKKTLLPYFIGALMVFGIGNLLEVVYYIAINIF